MSIEAWKSVFDWGAVGLILLTFAFGAGALITGNKINKLQESRLRQFDKDLTDAKTALGKQEELVEGLKGDNLKLEAKTLSLQKELLMQGPREKLLSGETRRVLVDSLKSFAGQKIDVRRSAILGSLDGISVGSSSIAEEASGLAKSLIGVLKDAGWKLPGVPLPSGSQGQGVSVQILDTSSAATQQAAKALVKALSEVPLAVNGPDSISDGLAKRSGTEVLSPAFDEDTIILVVHPR
jgi:hypothetical protein